MEQLDHVGVIGHDGTVLEGGGADEREGETGVVGGGVVVEVGAGQSLLGERGHVRHGFGLLEALVELADAGAAREVVHPHGTAEGARHLRVDQSVLGEDRDEEGQQAHEVRSVVAQPLPLPQGLVDESDVAVLEIAESSVHQLRALGRRAAGEVVPFDEGGAQPSRGRVEGHPGARDATPDDEQVEGGVLQLLQRAGTVEGAEGHVGRRLVPGRTRTFRQQPLLMSRTLTLGWRS